MLESGEFATIAELAEREGIASSYMTRLLLRLTLLSPAIVEASPGREARAGGYSSASAGAFPGGVG
jgi:DNA-binding IscR family transcriptional regulator